MLREFVRLVWTWPGWRGVATKCLYASCWLDFIVLNARRPNRPGTRFNDFLFAIKAGDEILNPLRKQISDKVEVKTCISSKLGPGKSLSTLAILDKADAIASFRPESYPVVVKPTHASG